MLKNSRSRSKIQRRIFYSFLVVLLMPTTLISISTYLISVYLLEEKVSNAFIQNLNYIGSSVERHLNEWESMTEYIYANHVIRRVMQENYDTEVAFFYDMLEADAVMKDYALGSNIYTDISSLVIIGENERNLLYGDNVSWLNYSQLKESDWYEKTLELDGQINWHGMERRSPMTTYEPYVVSLSRAMNVDDYNIAVIYLAFNQGYLKSILRDVAQDPQTKLRIIDNNNRTVFSDDEEDKLYSFEDTTELKRLQRQGESHFISEQDGEKMLIAYHYIEKYDWWVTEEISREELIKDNNQIFTTTAIVFAISFFIAGVLWYLVSRSIVKPIQDLSETMQNIGATNDLMAFTTDINSEDEIGTLNESFQSMLKQINALFNDVLEQQEKKKDAEYQALQAQINPHFLYNTLNTIRWMAIIQKADNIKEIVEVFARLIRNTFKHDGTFVTIQDELTMLKNYLYIQQIRYKDKFVVEYDLDDHVLDSLCVKFIMQPILENAIFHGIEPKEGQATIKIGIKKVVDQIQIIIQDDGIGMTRHEIEDVFNNPKRDGIGITNVNERVKYIYGVRSGFTIQSKPNVFTRVVIQFPYREQEKKDV